LALWETQNPTHSYRHFEFQSFRQAVQVQQAM
jgi:hypothetical protein